MRGLCHTRVFCGRTSPGGHAAAETWGQAAGEGACRHVQTAKRFGHVQDENCSVTRAWSVSKCDVSVPEAVSSF